MKSRIARFLCAWPVVAMLLLPTPMTGQASKSAISEFLKALSGYYIFAGRPTTGKVKPANLPKPVPTVAGIYTPSVSVSVIQADHSPDPALEKLSATLSDLNELKKIKFDLLNPVVVTPDAMLNRFLEYVVIDSQSQESEVPGEFPMTEGQVRMAEFLEQEAKALGADVYRSEDAYVYVTIPSNIEKDVPVLGISCHLDFTPEAPGGKITPIVERDYQGCDILLGGDRFLREDSPEGADLKNLIGKTIIHTDGTTLLGGDDKNGCAIAMSLVESMMKSGKNLKHGEVRVVFCPNEDVGLAAERIDTARFNPDILFDLDGEGASEVLASNFTARSQVVKFCGRYAHPGSAKEQHLGDALAAASSFIASVPLENRPENSEGTQGYIHPWKMAADGNDYTVHTRIRYFDKNEGDEFKSIMEASLEKIQKDFPDVKVEVLQDILQYENVAYNMHPASRNIIEKAAKRSGVMIEFKDVRGGTTASMFAAKGLRGGMCVFTGQHAIHSVYEYTVLEEMYKAYRLMLSVIDEVSKM